MWIDVDALHNFCVTHDLAFVDARHAPNGTESQCVEMRHCRANTLIGLIGGTDEGEDLAKELVRFERAFMTDAPMTEKDKYMVAIAFFAALANAERVYCLHQRMSANDERKNAKRIKTPVPEAYAVDIGGGQVVHASFKARGADLSDKNEFDEPLDLSPSGALPVSGSAGSSSSAAPRTTPPLEQPVPHYVSSEDSPTGAGEDVKDKEVKANPEE